MAIPKWDNEYSIHSDIIDAQHKKLFEIAEKAGTLISKQVDSKEIKKILAELFEYMKVHFRDEEQYMDSIGYPGTAYKIYACVMKNSGPMALKSL